MEDDEMHASPNNWGDPLVIYRYGMRYGEQPDFEYSCLILPQVFEETEEQNRWGPDGHERDGHQPGHRGRALHRVRAAAQQRAATA